MIEPIAVSAIRSRDFSRELGAFGQVEENVADIEQCIRIILQSPKGSRPHEPLFGCDAWKYLDRPMGEAIPQIIREVAEAVEMWEPRVTLESIGIDTENAAAGHLLLSIVWALAGPTETHTLEALLA